MSALEVLAQEASTDAPVLTLDETVSIALTNNRLVENEMLDAQKYDFRVKTIRSRRLPAFQFPARGSQKIVAEVRGAYFELVATQAAVDNTGRSLNPRRGKASCD